jgi:thioredoxin reductase (NADPH)
MLAGYSGPNIHYKVENLAEFKGKNVVIIGGGDSAFDTAVQLGEIAKTVTVLVKEKYAKAKENTVKLASEGGVQVLYNTEAAKIMKDLQGTLSGIQVTDTELNQERVLKADKLFIAIGFQKVRSFYENNGFELLEDGSVKVDEHLQTNIKGIYAAGDITGEIRLIATACAEGITAAINAFEQLKKPYWLH